MEYLQVFDDNKNMLDEKIERDKKLLLKNGKRFMIIVVFIENNEKKFLLQKTSVEKDSVIATTGGHATYGDDGIKTTIKETYEELGIKLDSNEINYVDTIIYPKCYVEVYYVNKNIDIDEIKLQAEEVESVSWYTIDEIKDLIKNNSFRKSNIEPFEKVLKFRKNR